MAPLPKLKKNSWVGHTDGKRVAAIVGFDASNNIGSDQVGPRTVET